MLEIDKQIIAVKKVQEEMEMAEEYLKKWDASWCEQLLDAYCLPLHFEIGESDVRDMEAKYKGRYKLANAFYQCKNIGIPLRVETIVGLDTLHGISERAFNVHFGRVDWISINSHKSTRRISFLNDGKIEFSKDIRPGQSIIKKAKRIGYYATFNVLSRNFDFSITSSSRDEEGNYPIKNRHFDFVLRDNLLTESIDNIDIKRDLQSGARKVKIEKEYSRRGLNNNISSRFEANINSDNSLKTGTLFVFTHKGNGKVNGTYCFNYNESRGSFISFISRKGQKINLAYNSELLNKVSQLMLRLLGNGGLDDQIIIYFVEAIRGASLIPPLPVACEQFNFDTGTINQVEGEVLDIVKKVQGEIPLNGLTKRLSYAVGRVENFLKHYEEDDDYKVLKMGTNEAQ